MAYIESLFYYLGVGFISFIIIYIIIFGGIFLVLFISVLIKRIIRSKKDDFSEFYEILIKVKNYKIFKIQVTIFFIITYITMISTFYIKQSYSYYGNDRSYPEAKAYAIVGDAVYLIHSFLFSFPRINIHENDLDNYLMAFQDFILNKMYQYIPKDDAEREYWEYKFKYQSIITQRYVPVTQKERDSKYRFFSTELGIAEYSPKIFNIMDELQRISKSLFYGNIKDKELDKGSRYLPIAHISYYLGLNFVQYTSLKRPEGDPYTVKSNLMFHDKDLYLKYLEYTNILVSLQEKINTNNDVKRVFENNPMNQAFLFASLLESFNVNIRYKISNNIYPCTLIEAQQYLQYHKKFDQWIENKKSSFNTLPKRGQRAVKSIFNGTGGGQSFFIIAKYICEIPINYYIDEEKRLSFYKEGNKEGLKKWLVGSLFKDRFEYEKIIQMKEEYTKGEEK